MNRRLLGYCLFVALLPSLHAAEPAAQSWPQVDQPLVISADKAPKLGTGDFSISMWARADAADRVTGDLISQYDPQRRRGFHLTLKSTPGGYTHLEEYLNSID